MFETFRNRVESMGTIKALCESAEQHARRDEQTEPGAEHFVLAAIDLPDGTAKLAFAKVGTDPAAFKTAIQYQYETALRDIGLDPGALNREAPTAKAVTQPHGIYRTAASGGEVMRALAADRKSHAPLLGAHVIAVVADMEHGVAARALKAMGVNQAALKRAAEDITRNFQSI